MAFKVVLLFVFSCLSLHTLSAQTANARPNDDLTNIMPTQTAEIHENWSFYEDQDNKVYYIDFENLKVNLNDISVLDEQGQVVMREDVAGLPVNTIYELDMSRFAPGPYTVSLRSHNGVINKRIEVRS